MIATHTSRPGGLTSRRSVRSWLRLCGLTSGLAFGLALALAVPPARAADESPAPVSAGFVFDEQGGQTVYRGLCQACHMPEGQGAVGAGMYPALKHNERLASAAYPIYNILHGRKGMPAFGKALTDAQIADVVNYVRTHLDNHYTDTVSAADVAKLR